MSFRLELLRNIGDNINSAKNYVPFDEGVVVEVSRKSKKAKVQFKNKNTAWCRVLFDKAEKDNWIGSMPNLKSRVLVLFLSNASDVFEDPIVIGQLFDGNNIPSDSASDAKDDQFYHSIDPSNGAKIEFYKTKDDKHKLKVTALGQINCTAVEEMNFVSSNISLGEANLTNKEDTLVKQPHLELYNKFVDEVNGILTSLFNEPTLGDMGIPMPLLVRNPSAYAKYITLQTKLALPTSSGGLKEDMGSSNNTSKVRAK